MLKVAKKLTDLIGNTPLLELSNFNNKKAVEQQLLQNWNISIPEEASKIVLHWP